MFNAQVLDECCLNTACKMLAFAFGIQVAHISMTGQCVIPTTHEMGCTLSVPPGAQVLLILLLRKLPGQEGVESLCKYTCFGQNLYFEFVHMSFYSPFLRTLQQCQSTFLRTSPCLDAQDILDRTKVGQGKISAFVELHIEQGPLLEREGVEIGVVTAIAAPASFRVQFNGDGGHAGALLMHDRSATFFVGLTCTTGPHAVS